MNNKFETISNLFNGKEIRSIEILEKHADARIVMVSSLAYDDTIEEAKKIGTKGFIYKPLEKENMLQRMRKALEE